MYHKPSTFAVPISRGTTSITKADGMVLMAI